MVTKEQAREKVRALVERFSGLVEQGQANSYNESLLKQNFIVPLFEALGWDVQGQNARTPQDLEVLVEETGKDRGRPDYEFRIQGKTKFFMEVKRPSVGVADPNSVLQAKSYSWSGNTHFAVLTDFQEIQLYETTIPPSRKNPRQGLRLKLLCEEFVGRFDDLWVLSKESVAAGALQGLQLKGKEARDREPVDARFLKELQHWREVLAKDLYKQNSRVSVQLLNEVVQRMLDRMVFVRIAEDRGVLERDQLKRVAEKYRESGGHIAVHDLLLRVFHEVNAKLNGEIFKPGHAVEREEYWFDSAPLVKIIEWLCEDDPGYRFDVIPVELLGTIYERYLGNTIRLTEKRVKVEEKPEVRKAGGVFYTPKYIVDYIVENTVGKLVEGKSPGEVAKLKILDPACGSGSFLLGAYQKLIDYHIRWYQAHPEQAKGNLIANGPKSQPRLTIEEKARILKNNIHGVDIDQQAVEITMMSLYVKALEGERAPPRGREVLPRLGENIRCGNSLIGTDIYDATEKTFTDEEKARINAFDWQSKAAGFGGLLDAGGFEVVISNPPYIQLSMMDYYDDASNEYISQEYTSSMGRLNTFGLFIERALRVILRNDGYLSYIVPNTLLTQEYYQELRREILRYDLVNITTYENPVFVDAVVETTVFVLRKSSTSKNKVQIVRCDNENMTYESRLINQKIYQNTHVNAFLVNIDSSTLALRTKLENVRYRLKDVANINQAIALKHDRSKSLFMQKKSSNFKKVLDGRNIQRYSLEWSGYYLAYDLRNIHSCKRTDIFETEEKLFFRRVGDRLIATYDSHQYYALNTLVVITQKNSNEASLKYLLCLINSRLLNFYYVTYLKSTKKVFSEIQARQLAQIPIRPIDPSNPADKVAHDELVRLVDRMLELHKQKAPLPESAERERVEREIAATDERIDGIVYKLYGITEEEKKIIEGASK